MAIVKYFDTPPKKGKSIKGFTFQPANQVQEMKKKAGQRHTITPIQRQRSAIQMECCREWQTLNSQTKTNWLTWASQFPQPLRDDEFNFIGAYTNFVKINYYRRLHFGITHPTLTDPVLHLFDPDPVTISPDLTANYLKLNLTFERNSGELLCFIFAKENPSQRKSVQRIFIQVNLVRFYV